MSIYDVTYYGVYYRYKHEFSGVRLYRKKEEIKTDHEVENILFDVRALKSFQGKSAVLKITFEDESVEYETLYEPGCYFDKDTGLWEKAAYREIPNQFLKLYEQASEDDKEGEGNLIFQNFYKIIGDVTYCCKVYRKRHGKDFVVEATYLSKDISHMNCEETFCLINPDYYYLGGRWGKCQKNSKERYDLSIAILDYLTKMYNKKK